MTELSIISSRRCEALLARRVEPIPLFLRVACQIEYFTVHQIPATRKKVPGRACPLKLPMIPLNTSMELKVHITQTLLPTTNMFI